MILIAPSVIIIFGLLVYPLLRSLYISFFDLHITTPWIKPTFLGLGNYTSILTSGEVREAFGRTLYLAVIGILIGIPLALSFALLLNRRFPLRGLVRSLMLIPWAVPGVVNGLMWARIYDAHFGALNGLLYQFGIIHDYIPWLVYPEIALLLVALADLWSSVPMMSLLFLAGLQSIPQELYDAAAVDGATGWNRFANITLPLLSSVMLINLVLKTISAFGLFDLVYLLTSGGPANSTQVIGYYLYVQGFQRQEFGYTSALAWLIATMILVLVVVYARLLRGQEAQA
ncbi:MAG TPA: sugar ABC transporter permease [Aggregatilineaceae bacterium]|nr:sugar ABC transporter permease [Aggregatilineaceae bacterium]